MSCDNTKENRSIRGIIPTAASVCVLMSSYNGEKYLQEQLDSLYEQQGVSMSILVRDDGSTDATQMILDSNCNEHECIRWYTDGHLGPAKSYLNLIAHAPEADFYALCDQDDVWDSDKLNRAVDMMRGLRADEPALYYSNLRIADKDLNYHRDAHSRPWVMKSKYSALVDAAATGCTMVFNKALCNLLKSRMPDECKMHDEWIFLVCSFFGTVIYDFEPHISYRQHGGNVLGTHVDGIALKWLIQKAIRTEDKSWLPRSVNARSFLDAYGDMLSERELNGVRKVADCNGSFRNRIALITDSSIRGMDIKRDLLYRIKVITGRA